mgnify:CR=1 FL=1
MAFFEALAAGAFVLPGRTVHQASGGYLLLFFNPPALVQALKVLSGGVLILEPSVE